MLSLVDHIVTHPFREACECSLRAYECSVTKICSEITINWPKADATLCSCDFQVKILGSDQNSTTSRAALRSNLRVLENVQATYFLLLTVTPTSFLITLPAL
jgi:hypothetical protein